MTATTNTLGFHSHDHASCITDCVGQVDRLCQAQGLQFTPVRRRVLEILLEGAYDILDVLRAEGLDRSRRWYIARWIF